MTTPGDLPHLARRFLASIRPAPLSPDEQHLIAGLLTEAEARLFWQQAAPDRRHGIDSLHRMGEGRDPVLRRAALLHDIGKRHSGLGPVGRSLATALAWVGLARWRRARDYRDHGRIGAEELAALGAETLVIAFARHHHAGRPPEIDPESWELLISADHD